MPHEFAENEFALEPEASSAQSGGPPRKRAGIGVIDPPVPPKRSPGPNPAGLVSVLLRILGGLLLLGGILFLLFARR
jgi:hypothetical protein